MNRPGLRLFTGAVMHRRHGPQGLRFRHRVFALLAPLERRPALNRWWPLLGHNRPALLALHDRDHGPRDGSPLGPWIGRHLADAGIDLAGGHIELLAMPRILGYAFNPLSVWYCHHADGGLRAVLMEVRNTFGEWHGYLLHEQGRPLPDPYTPEVEKVFHVSPFQALDGRYRFRISDPAGSALALGIRLYRHDELCLTAVQRGRLRSLAPGALLGALVRSPLLTFKVSFMIHWHALRLWRRGAPFHRKPQPPLEEITQ